MKDCQTASAEPTSAATTRRRYAGMRAWTSMYEAPNTTPDCSVSRCGIRSHAPKARTTSSTAPSSERCRLAAPLAITPRIGSSARLPAATCDPATPTMVRMTVVSAIPCTSSSIGSGNT